MWREISILRCVRSLNLKGLQVIAVDPMHDELASGHESRRMTILGSSSEAEHLQRMREALDSQANQQTPRLHLLAMCANMTPESYAMRHSMLGCIRVACDPYEIALHGSPATATFSRRLGMDTQISSARVCYDCIEDQLASHGFGWYRRVHHIAGVDWCIEHRVPLFELQGPAVFRQEPRIWKNAAVTTQLDARKARFQSDSFLERYASIAAGLLRRSRPVCRFVLHHANGKQAGKLKLAQRSSSSGTFISDRLLKLADRTWLEQNIQGFASKRSGCFFGPIDWAGAEGAKRCTGTNYAIVFATLYESPQRALSAIDKVDESKDYVEY